MHATVKQVRGEWMVLVNGDWYGSYSSEQQAKEVAASFKGELAN